MWHVKINYTDDSSRKKIVHNYYPETNQLYASEVCTCGIASLFFIADGPHLFILWNPNLQRKNIILLMMFHDEEQWKSVVKHRFSLVWSLIKKTPYRVSCHNKVMLLESNHSTRMGRELFLVSALLFRCFFETEFPFLRLDDSSCFQYLCCLPGIPSCCIPF